MTGCGKEGLLMKIEKVNDNQIRCTLTREDLASRQLKISELAYGTEKAKSLFRDMMQQANYEFGFEAEDIPLMIEAIPLNAECIVLIITKVEDPEELDTRFSRFAPSFDELEEDDNDNPDGPMEENGGAMDLFQKLKGSRQDAANTERPQIEQNKEIEVPAPAAECIFRMNAIQTVMAAAMACGQFYTGLSSLYKEESTGKYLLVLSQGDMALEDFNRVCNVLSEYGSLCRNQSAGSSSLQEHCSALIKADALRHLCTA